MFCVRREDRESEWLIFGFGIDQVTRHNTYDVPQPWPLHKAVEYVNWHRAEDYPVAVFAIDEGDPKENPPRQVYPSEAMLRVNA